MRIAFAVATIVLVGWTNATAAPMARKHCQELTPPIQTHARLTANLNKNLSNNPGKQIEAMSDGALQAAAKAASSAAAQFEVAAKAYENALDELVRQLEACQR